MTFKYALASAFSIFALAAASQAQSNPPAWSPSISYKIGDEVAYEGVDFKCLINETTAHPTPHTTSWEISFVYSGALTIPVGPSETIKTLAMAWTYIADARISNTSSVTIKLDNNYTETIASNFSLNHPYGAKISIIGQNVGQTITFKNQNTGFVLDSGHILADFEGVTIIAPSILSNGTAGVTVKQNAVLQSLHNTNIRNFTTGLLADTGGVIDNISTLSLGNFAIGGVEADNGANITFSSPITVDGSSSAPTSPPQFGFKAQGGTINCGKSTVIECYHNFVACHSGKIEADESTSNGLTNGFDYANYYAYDHGFISAVGSSSSGATYGYLSVQSSFIDATQSTAGGYQSDGFYAGTGGTIDATQNKGGSAFSSGSSDGSYIFGI